MRRSHECVCAVLYFLIYSDAIVVLADPRCT